MSAIIRIQNFGTANYKQESYLMSDYAKGQTTIACKSALGAVADLFVIIGMAGSEGAEIRRIQSVSGDTITLTAATAKDHKQFEKVTIVYCDKLRVYRAPNVDGTEPIDANFTLLSPVDIDPERPDTDYIDAAGNNNYWYKFTYFNSINASETNRSESRAVRGGGVTDYCSIEDIKGEANLQTNRNLSDSFIALRRLDAQAEINTALTGVYQVPFSDPIPQTIAYITRVLTAGFLLPGARGESKIKEARSILMDLQNRQKRLIDAGGNDLSLTDSVGFQMWPNADTATAAANDGGAERLFRISDTQGYESRLY